jgi:class 3 adenylate cyclase
MDQILPALGLVFGGAGRSCASSTTESVTVLFTDMVRSTALATSLAPDAADEFRREHFSILRQAVAEAGGIEVKAPRNPSAVKVF